MSGDFWGSQEGCQGPSRPSSPEESTRAGKTAGGRALRQEGLAHPRRGPGPIWLERNGQTSEATQLPGQLSRTHSFPCREAGLCRLRHSLAADQEYPAGLSPFPGRGQKCPGVLLAQGLLARAGDFLPIFPGPPGTQRAHSSSPRSHGDGRMPPTVRTNVIWGLSALNSPILTYAEGSSRGPLRKRGLTALGGSLNVNGSVN